MRWTKFSENLKMKINGLAEVIGKTVYWDIYQDGVDFTKEYANVKDDKTGAMA